MRSSVVFLWLIFIDAEFTNCEYRLIEIEIESAKQEKKLKNKIKKEKNVDWKWNGKQVMWRWWCYLLRRLFNRRSHRLLSIISHSFRRKYDKIFFFCVFYFIRWHNVKVRFHGEDFVRAKSFALSLSFSWESHNPPIRNYTFMCQLECNSVQTLYTHSHRANICLAKLLHSKLLNCTKTLAFREMKKNAKLHKMRKCWIKLNHGRFGRKCKFLIWFIFAE